MLLDAAKHGSNLAVLENRPIRAWQASPWWAAASKSSRLGNPDYMRHLRNGSIAAYGGVKDVEIEFPYNAIALEHYAGLIGQARTAVVRMLESKLESS